MDRGNHSPVLLIKKMINQELNYIINKQIEEINNETINYLNNEFISCILFNYIDCGIYENTICSKDRLFKKKSSKNELHYNEVGV